MPDLNDQTERDVQIPPRFAYYRTYLKLHTRPVVDAGFNLDDDMFFTASLDGYVAIWCAITGYHLHTFDKFPSAVRSAAFSPDSKLFAVGQMDREFYVFSLVDYSKLCVESLPENEKGVKFIGFSDDGTLLYVVTTNFSDHYRVLQYYVNNGALAIKNVSKEFSGTPQSCLVSLDRMLLSCDDGRLVTYDLLEDDTLNEDDFGNPAPDMTLFREKYAVVPLPKAKKVYFYDFQTDVYQLATEYNVNSCAVHPLKNFCALAGGINARDITTTSNSDETLVTYFYDLEKKCMIFQVKLHAGPTWRIRWTSDGLGMLSVSEDGGCCLLRFTREGFTE